MKRYGWFAGSVGVLVLSVGLMLMTDTASYGSGTKNWDGNLAGTLRFTVLPSFGNHAVRDNNTGLVWEQAPDATRTTWGGPTGGGDLLLRQ